MRASRQNGRCPRPVAAAQPQTTSAADDRQKPPQPYCLTSCLWHRLPESDGLSVSCAVNPPWRFCAASAGLADDASFAQSRRRCNRQDTFVGIAGAAGRVAFFYAHGQIFAHVVFFCRCGGDFSTSIRPCACRARRACGRRAARHCRQSPAGACRPVAAAAAQSPAGCRLFSPARQSCLCRRRAKHMLCTRSGRVWPSGIAFVLLVA